MGLAKREYVDVGFSLFLGSGRFYDFWWKGGWGTNSIAEIIALWGVLNFGKWLGLEKIFVHGDAKSIIDWFKEYTLFSPHICPLGEPH